MTMQDLNKEEKRIIQVYASRDNDRKYSLYGWHKPDSLLNEYSFRSATATMLKSAGLLEDLSSIEALDVGCGTGGWMRTLLEWGATPEKLHGVDLLEDRINRAKLLSPGLDFRKASAWPIPFDNESMDLVCAHTVFSSILDFAARKKLAKEMLRVSKPGGLIFIYDFRVSHPLNPDTIGIRSSEIRLLFPGLGYNFRSLTLAPPIARFIAPISSSLAFFLESFFPFLRTHAIFIIKKQSGEKSRE